MNGLNHLREQCTHTLVDKILEEMYTSFIIQVQPKLFLKLYNKKVLVLEQKNSCNQFIEKGGSSL